MKKSNIRENKKFTLNITYAMNIESEEQKERERELSAYTRTHIFDGKQWHIITQNTHTHIDTKALNNQDEY